MRFEIVFKRGTETLATVKGLEVNPAHLTVEDVRERIIDTEQYLERILRTRIHIQENHD